MIPNLQPAEGAPPIAADAAQADADQGRILIVDDNEINRRLLASMLRRERYTLLSASDGVEALALVREHLPDLILLDIMMPGTDGYEVCAILKRDPRTAPVPVIFLSALSETADKIKGLELGAVDYITKPFDHGEVLARVRSQLKIQRLTADLRSANRDLEEKQARIGEDLKAAAAIQHSLVPAVPPPIPALRTAWRFLPCDKVGGDLFNFCTLGEDHLGVYMIDVSGHGVPAAMVTVSVSQFLSPQAQHLLRASGAEPRPAAPSEVLARLDAEYPMERFDKYFTVAYALIDHQRGRVRYTRAGHPRPMLLRADGTVETLDAGGPIIGLGMECEFEEADVPFAPGDRLFLYTDGLIEIESPSGEPFGEERLVAALAGLAGVPLETACDRLMAALARFAEDAPPQDDITLLVLELVHRAPAHAGRGTIAAAQVDCAEVPSWK